MSDIIGRYKKVASAAYLITSFFHDSEPLKWRLRSLSTDLIGETVKNKYELAKEINNLFSLAKNAGLMSETNFNILHQELGGIENELSKPVELLLPAAKEEKIALKEPEIQVEKIKDKIAEERPSLREFGVVSVKKNNRQSTIINLLKRKKEIMIKDVSPLIQGCSEKTIQRELSQMVSAGILLKMGEKRWTRYTLARTYVLG